MNYVKPFKAFSHISVRTMPGLMNATDQHPPTVAENIFSEKYIEMEDPVALESCDITINKTELFDVNVMNWLITDAHREGKIDNETQRRLKLYYKNAKNGNEASVQYVLGKKLKHEFLGRWCAVKGLGLQNFWKDIRNALANRFYWDLDIDNCHPVLLSQLCDRKGWACPNIKHLIENRSEVFDSLTSLMKCDRAGAKAVVIAVFFGGRQVNDLPPFIKHQLYPELQRIMKNIIKEYPKEFQNAKRRKEFNLEGATLSAVLQTEERKCLMSLDRALTRLERRLDTLIHDGGLVRKLENETELPVAVMRTCEAAVLKDTGYKVNLSVKPMETSFVIPQKRDEYVATFVKKSEYDVMKLDFEEKFFYLVETGVICEERNDGNLFMYEDIGKAKTALSIKYAWRRYNEDKKETEIVHFIDIWIDDISRRTIRKLVFIPTNGDIHPDDYNLWKGWEVAKTPLNDKSRDPALLAKYHDHLRMLSGNTPLIQDFITKFISHMLQYPEVIPGVMLVFVGEQGVGKSMLWEFLGKCVIGLNAYLQSDDPEEEVFGKHATLIQGKLLVQMEEMSAFASRSNANRLKSMITKTIENINPKGKSMYTMNNYKRYVGTTNDVSPVKVEGTDRRYVVSYVSSEKMVSKEHPENRAFWNEMGKYYADPDVARAVFEFHMNQDLSDFEVRNKPETQYTEMLKEHEKPYEVQFIESWDGDFNEHNYAFLDEESTQPTIQSALEKKMVREGKSSEMHKKYRSWCEKQGLNPTPLNHFGRLISPLVMKGILSSRKKDGITLYKKVIKSAEVVPQPQPSE